MDVEEILVEMLSMGYNVNLEGLGTFSLSLGFEDDKPTEIQGDDDKMTYRKVGVRDVNFKASPDFIKSVKQVADRDLERDMGGVKLILKKKYTREERIARALDVINENGFIGLTDYAYINNLSRTAASLELKEISHDETVPIRSVGQHSLLGKTAVVTAEIHNLEGRGEVFVNGLTWTARTEKDSEVIPKDAHVEIIAVEGVKLIVREKKEG